MSWILVPKLFWFQNDSLYIHTENVDWDTRDLDRYNFAFTYLDNGAHVMVNFKSENQTNQKRYIEVPTSIFNTVEWYQSYFL